MSEEIKFEKSMERLEKIVEDLEAGNISLEEALKKYEEGVKLLRSCQTTLTQAEKKIEMLTRSLSGKLEKGPLDLEEAQQAEAGRAEKKKPRRTAPAPEAAGEDEDLLL